MARSSTQNYVIADLTSDSEVRAFMNSMTKPRIKEFLLEQFAVKITNFDRTAKPKLIEHIVTTWSQLKAKQVSLFVWVFVCFVNRCLLFIIQCLFYHLVVYV